MKTLSIDIETYSHLYSLFFLLKIVDCQLPFSGRFVLIVCKPPGQPTISSVLCFLKQYSP